jgi:hypothetical protein
MAAQYTRYAQRGPNFGVDLNALAVQACKNLAAKAERRRQIAQSGQREMAGETVDSLVVVQEAAPPLEWDPFRVPRVKWSTTGSVPHGLEQLTVYGTVQDAERNGWTLHELMKRRLHRAYKDALVAAKVCDNETAKRWARESKVHVADLGLVTQ